MELKALEFLKEQKRRHQNMANTRRVIYFDDELDEAISELEALQNRSCESCKHSYDIFESFKNEDDKNQSFVCTKLKVDKVFNVDFSCSLWESKC